MPFTGSIVSPSFRGVGRGAYRGARGLDREERPAVIDAVAAVAERFDGMLGEDFARESFVSSR